jgi:benzoate-CoA ligase
MSGFFEPPETFNMTTRLLDYHLGAGRGERVAIRFRDRKIRYRELAEGVARVAHALLGLGVQMEQRVMLLLPDCPEFIAVFLGAMRIGAVPVPVNTLAPAKDYEYYLGDSRATALIVHQEFLPKVEAARRWASALRHTVVVGEAPQAIPYEEWIRGQPTSIDPAQTHRDDAAYWLYSSGTTGRPKGIIHLHHDMVYCTGTYAQHVLAMTENDMTFSVPRLFFSYGLVNSLYLPLFTGASVLLCQERPDPRRVFEHIEHEHPTLFFSVPTSFVALLLEAEGRKPDLSSLRLCVTAGEPLPEPLYHRWRETFGVELLDGIGATEVGYIFISNRAGTVRPGSSGTPLPGYEVRIVDEAGRDLPDGEVGDLLIKGESVAAGYWNQHPRTKAAFIGEWYRTGDKYYRDTDGYYFYVSRSDDLLRVGAQWVSPHEVEAALLCHAAVAEAAVVGGVDEHGLTKPRAFVVLRPGTAPAVALSEELQAHVRGKLPSFKAPRWIEFIPELPKTATGKIQRYSLRQREIG